MSVRRRASRRVLVASFLLVARAAAAQSGGAYDLTRNTIDGGGATFSSGGADRLGATIGQPDAGASRGGNFTLRGGFWPAVFQVKSRRQPRLPVTR